MAFEHLIVSDRGKSRVITINRPEALNALSKGVFIDLEKAIREAEQHPGLRAVVLTGAGEKSFVSGADISEMKSLSPMEAEQFSAAGQRVMDLVASSRLPYVAAVNGYALGGGLELALACDFIYASQNATFGLVETKLGLIPGFGGTARLCRRVGEALAREMIYSASQISADEAQRIGLVNRVVPAGEVVAASVAIAEKIASRGPYAVRLAKALIQDSFGGELRTANALEQKCFGLVFSSNDHSEGLNAFLEKRPPNFEGN